MDRPGEQNGRDNAPRRTLEIRIRRFNPQSQESPKDSVYTIVYQEGMTLHHALKEIYRALDPSIAFRPYSCNKGICMSCLVSLNGKRRQACTTFVKPGDILSVDADPARAVIRDLVTFPRRGEDPSQ